MAYIRGNWGLIIGSILCVCIYIFKMKKTTRKPLDMKKLENMNWIQNIKFCYDNEMKNANKKLMKVIFLINEIWHFMVIWVVQCVRW